MEGLTKGWYRTRNLNGKWHYYDALSCLSVCTLVESRIPKQYLEKFEITEGTICRSCEVIINSDKVLDYAQHLLDGKVLASDRTCAEPGCNITGGAFIPTNKLKEEKPHYCIKHNPLVKVMLESEKC